MSERYCSECEVTYRSEACPTCGWSEPPHTLADCREAMENHVGQRVQVPLDVERLARVLDATTLNEWADALSDTTALWDMTRNLAAEYARLSRTGENE